MPFLTPGQAILVHAYKHNGNIYRCWDKAIVLEHTSDHLILINEDVVVTEVNGRKWKTSEPAIWFFDANHWSNIICMLKQNGISYYSNLASPYIVEDNVVKYVDYDLDFKVFADHTYKVLDLKEFNRNRVVWRYSPEITDFLWDEVERLKMLLRDKDSFFNEDNALAYWTKFQEWKRQQDK